MAVGLLATLNSALRQRDFNEVQRALVALVALAPAHAEVLRMRGVVAHLQGHRSEAIECLRRALLARPDDVALQRDLGHALSECGDWAGALEAFQGCARQQPERADHWINIARVLEHRGEPGPAHDALRRALEREPRNTTARLLLARLLVFMGRTADAEVEYRQLLKTQPHSAMAWHGLSTLRTTLLDVADLALIEQVCTRADLVPHERAAALFALAKALEDVGRHADAYRALGAANATRRKQLYWDAGVFSHHVRAIEQAFEGACGGSHGEGSDGIGSGLVFLVGMPRSGSTLVEQILASHPQASAGGELEHLSDILRGESQRLGSDFPTWVAQADAADWRRLGHDYLQRIAHRRGARPTFTDKGLLNWRYIGALQAMLPGARIVDCRRDALETCLGAWRQMFASDLAFTYDLAELAAFWRDYDHAMHAWQRRFPDRIHVVEHERLAADPGSEIRRLLAFCGLPFDPACLRFHDSERIIATASAAQVREPLRRDTARAHRYGALLDPLRALLAQAVDAGD